MGPHLRLATPRDAGGLRDIYAPIVLDSPTSFELVPPSEEEMAARVRKTLPRFPWLVCAAGERLLGHAYAGAHNERAAYQWSVNVSVYVHAQARRMGVGHALYGTLFAILRLQGFFGAYAGITLPNAASVGFHESLGFTSVGTFEGVGYKLGAWHDVGYWHRTIQPRDGSPAPPQPLPSLLNNQLLREELTAGSEKLGQEPLLVAEAFDAGNLPQAR